MNNSFPRLIEGMCATLRAEVLPRLDDEFARGQVFGVINLLNTFKVRADWSAGFLLQQIEVQRQALVDVAALVDGAALLEAPSLGRATPPKPLADAPAQASIAELLAQRDAGNAAIGQWLSWLDTERAQRRLGTEADPAAAPESNAQDQAERRLRQAMRAEADSELKHSSRPMFAQMSSGRED